MKHVFGRLYKRGKDGREIDAGTKGNGVYYLQYQVGGKRVRQRLTGEDGQPVTALAKAEEMRRKIVAPFMARNEVEALQAVKEKLATAETALAAAKDEATPALTIKDAWDAFDRSGEVEAGEATKAIYAFWWGRFCRWIKEAHPDVVCLREVTADMAGEYANHLLSRKLSLTKKTFNEHRAFLLMLFRVLAEKGRLSSNPWEKIKRFKKAAVKPQSRLPLGTDDLRKICMAAEGELRPLLALGLYLGARLGDAATMTWENIDMRRRRMEYVQRKTGKEIKVRLHDRLHAVLNEIPSTKRNGFIVPELAHLYLEKGPRYVSNRVQAHFTHCGLTTTRAGTGARRVVSAGFHSLRHSAVTFLREANIPLSVTMAIVGHDSVAMHDIYTKHGAEAVERAVNSLPDVFRETAAPVALPPADPVAVLKAEINRLADTLTADNAAHVRKALLALASVGNVS